MTKQTKQFGVIAIPLNRPDIIRFLLERSSTPRGAPLIIIGQRPTAQAESDWLANLGQLAKPIVSDLLAIDDPHNHLTPTWTDRLVPRQFLDEPNFLTRNLGGWTAIYFGVAELPGRESSDPLLSRFKLLTKYGDCIRYFGADPAQVEARWAEELIVDVPTVVQAWSHLHQLRRRLADQRNVYIERIYAALIGEDTLEADVPVPDMILFDVLLGELIRLEIERRQAVADGKPAEVDKIEAQQAGWQDQRGLHFILKGEYIVGRHRRSTILIAPELGVVVKQPAPEPLHEIELNAKIIEGQVENWPYSTGDGALVTARGRLRLVIEERIVPRLSDIFGHTTRFSTLTGLTVEPFVTGQTVQAYIQADPRRLTPNLYEQFVLHQQVCELIGGENGDWHSANFILQREGQPIVHIDWGAARPLYAHEYTAEGRAARLNQVQNIGFSFHDDDLANLVTQRHADLMADSSRLERVRRRAQALIDSAS